MRLKRSKPGKLKTDFGDFALLGKKRSLCAMKTLRLHTKPKCLPSHIACRQVLLNRCNLIAQHGKTLSTGINRLRKHDGLSAL
jgi:hypothetical protein